MLNQMKMQNGEKLINQSQESTHSIIDKRKMEYSSYSKKDYSYEDNRNSNELLFSKNTWQDLNNNKEYEKIDFGNQQLFYCIPPQQSEFISPLQRSDFFEQCVQQGSSNYSQQSSPISIRESYSHSFDEGSNQRANNQQENENEKEVSHHPQILMKKKFQVSLIGTKIKRDFYQNVVQIPQNLSPYKRIYLFLDQVLDIDYIKSIAYEQEEEYVKENQFSQIFSGIQMVERIEHRRDNKYIDICLENSNQYCPEIAPILEYIRSLGNYKLKMISDSLELYWMNHVNVYKKKIREDKQKEYFHAHQDQRNQAVQKSIENLTKGLPENELYCYFHIKINYDKEQFDVVRVGYSPMLFTLIGGSPYEFIDHIMKNGFFDPLGLQFRLQSCIKLATSFLSSRLNNKQYSTNDYSLRIPTVDNFSFPSTIKTVRYYLNEEYDRQHSLHGLSSDVLSLMKFEVQDLPQILDTLAKIRENKPNQLAIINEEDSFHSSDFDFSKTQFFQKYYSDQVNNLLRKGNKWFKRCGFVDIPQKKKKFE